MPEFFDTSVLVAAFWSGHPCHEASVRLFGKANPKRSAASVHTLAEVYSVMTALPVKPALPPEVVMLFVREVRERLTLVTLSAPEYFAAIQKAASQGFTGGRIYDALLLRCAAKLNANPIYTWNLKHFQSLAPELAERIRTP
jgi:predicted nucleic acid-binding protein